MKVYYDKDADLSLIKGKNVTIIGYGSQGHAHAQNLNDSGVKVTVGLRRGGASWSKVEKAGLRVAEVAEAVKSADVVMILLPDEQIAAVYKNDVEPHIRQGASHPTRRSRSSPRMSLRWKLRSSTCSRSAAVDIAFKKDRVCSSPRARPPANRPRRTGQRQWTAPKPKLPTTPTRTGATGRGSHAAKRPKGARWAR